MAIRPKTKPAYVSPLNLSILTLIVEALFKTSTELPWQNAITKAGEKLPALPTRTVKGHLVIASDSHNVYAATRDECQCEAFTEGHKPCWHRAAAVIMDRYAQAEAFLKQSA